MQAWWSRLLRAGTSPAGVVEDHGRRRRGHTVRDLVVGSGIEFEDRGARELKGVPGEWRLFAVAS